MQIDTTHNPVIQLVETTAIIIAAESSVVLTVGLRVITVVGVGWSFMVLKLTWQVLDWGVVLMSWVIPNNPVEQSYVQLHSVNMCIHALYCLSTLIYIYIYIYIYIHIYKE